MPANFESLLKDHEVRLFPTTGAKGKEAEDRASAILLATVAAVAEFGKRVVKAAGGPGGRIRCYSQVPIEDFVSSKKRRPDGVIVAKWGKTRWTALVEVKIGKDKLTASQVNDYHQWAVKNKLDAIVTISNEPAGVDGRCPVAGKLHGKRLKSVPVFHFSWERLLTEAVLLSAKGNVADSDQHWILEEWIRYATDEKSRVIEPPELGQHWNDVLRVAKTNSLRPRSKEFTDVAEHWVGYLRILALQMRKKLGADVRLKAAAGERKRPEQRIENLRAEAGEPLSGTLVVPGAAGEISIGVFLASRTVRYSLTIDAPRTDKQGTRLNWLVRQLKRLKHPPSSLEVQIAWQGRRRFSRGPVSLFLKDKRHLLVDSKGATVASDNMPTRFTIIQTRDLPRTQSTRKLLAGITSGLEVFYRDCVQIIDQPVTRTPRLPD